jgi:hypothetical protein
MVMASANVYGKSMCGNVYGESETETLQHTLAMLVSHTQGKTLLRLEPLGNWKAEAGQLGVVQHLPSNS